VCVNECELPTPIHTMVDTVRLIIHSNTDYNSAVSFHNCDYSDVSIYEDAIRSD